MLLFYIYVASFVIGGVLLAASLFLGGHDADGDLDLQADADADADVGVDADADVHVELDAGAHVDVDAGAGAGAGAAAGDGGLEHAVGSDGVGISDLWLPFLSVRFWVFFLCFFGLTGLVLTLLALAGRWSTLFAALGMGAVTGFAAAFIIQRLKRSEVGLAVSVEEYQGKEGIVLLPIEPNERGKVRLELRGQTVDVVARTDGQATVARGRKVLVIEVRGQDVLVEPAPELEGAGGRADGDGDGDGNGN